MKSRWYPISWLWICQEMSLISVVRKWCLGTFQDQRSPVRITVSIQSFLDQSRHSLEYFVCLFCCGFFFTIFCFLDKSYFIIWIVGTAKKLSKRKSKMKWEGQLMNPAKHLFIWAVLMNRMSMAKLFWRIGSDHIGRNVPLWIIVKKMFYWSELQVQAKMAASETQPGKDCL